MEPVMRQMLAARHSDISIDKCKQIEHAQTARELLPPCSTPYAYHHQQPTIKHTPSYIDFNLSDCFFIIAQPKAD